MLCALCCLPVRDSDIDCRWVNGKVVRLCVICTSKWNVGFSYDEIRMQHIRQCKPCLEVFNVIMGNV